MKNNQFIFLKNSIQLSWLKSPIYLIIVSALSGCIEDQHISDGFNRVTQSFFGGEMEFSCRNNDIGIHVFSKYKIKRNIFTEPKVFKEIGYKWKPIDATITENSIITGGYYLVNGLPLEYLSLNDLDIPDPMYPEDNKDYSSFALHFNNYIEEAGNNNRPSFITEINFGSSNYTRTLADEAINHIKLSDSYKELAALRLSMQSRQPAHEKLIPALNKYGTSYRIKTPVNTVFETGRCFL